MLNLTFFLNVYASYRRNQLARSSSAEIQQRELVKLVSQAAYTRFGQEHNFKDIRSVSDYQKAVPLRKYEDFWNDYWKEDCPKLTNVTWPGTVPFFAVSSGTTSGTTKYIPYSWEMNKSNTKAGLDLLVHHLTNYKGSKIFSGKSFMLGGSSDLVSEAPGIYSGDLSGIAVKTLPWWAKMRYFPPQDLALLKDWEKKIDILSTRAFDEEIKMISGVPSWLLIFFEKLFELKPEAGGKLHRVLPDLEMLVHGGVNFAPYYDRFQELLGDSPIQLREVYPASEGFIAIADRGYNEGLRLILDHGIFFEFVPLEELENPNPPRFWIDDIETGVNYAVIMSTCAGLWGYVLGDTVRFTETDPPRLLITGRTSYYLSAFGEHLIAEEIEDAVSTAAKAVDTSVVDYSVGAVYPDSERKLGGHLYIVEFSTAEPRQEKLDAFREVLDRKLCERNEDYEAHRSGGYGLSEPDVLVVKTGTFKAWMKSRGKLGGQHKVPRIITDRELFNSLREFVTPLC